LEWKNDGVMDDKSGDGDADVINISTMLLYFKLTRP